MSSSPHTHVMVFSSVLTASFVACGCTRSSGVSPLQTVSDPAATNPAPDVESLGRQVAQRYRSLSTLAFELVATESRQDEDGRIHEPRRAARAEVCMGKGGELRLIVHDPGRPAPVLHRICDGRTFTEWTSAQWTSYPADCYNGNVNVASDFDFCYVGGVLQSWLGPRSGRPDLYEARIGAGSYVGTELVDGVRCHVVMYDRRPQEDFLIRDRFYVDEGEHLVRRWTTMQATLSKNGDVSSHITRVRDHRGITVDAPVSAAAFSAVPPPTARRVPSSTPADLVGQPLPTVAVARWVQGAAEIGAGASGDWKVRPRSVVLLDIMASWCEPCRTAMPELVRLHEELGGRGFQTVSLCVAGGDQQLDAVLRADHARHPVGVLQADASKALHAAGLPTYLLIDRQGIVRDARIGALPERHVIEELVSTNDSK